MDLIKVKVDNKAGGEVEVYTVLGIEQRITDAEGITGAPGPPGIPGVPGVQGAPGTNGYDGSNLDGGAPDTIYGGELAISGGDVNGS